MDPSTDGRRPVPGALVLLRHGQSTANAEVRFTGWAESPRPRTPCPRPRPARVHAVANDRDGWLA
ncbi:hypothetical protein [Mangrovactinospora gilvigrisea]|uniref:hypothetical protein n=1 Tax=Mangrovactinospora gilvigrisea TaxID=1428644 RepID=UPI0008FC342F|nr:hypothetical protein [Mangrovactinospora gilvigrisea]